MFKKKKEDPEEKRQIIFNKVAVGVSDDSSKATMEARGQKVVPSRNNHPLHTQKL